MAVTSLPIDSTSQNYDVDIELSQQLYRFNILWNERDQGWSIGISQPDDTPIVRAVRIRTGMVLFRLNKSALLPPGVIMVMDTSTVDQATEPTRTSLGDQHLIIYDDLES